MNIALAILYIYPSASPLTDFRVEDNGSGPTLKDWNLPEPQPTQQELEVAWVGAQAAKVASDGLYAARLAMADAFHSLPDQVRADHSGDYLACEHAIIRGDIAAAKKRIETMAISTAVPVDQREPLRSSFLALFP